MKITPAQNKRLHQLLNELELKEEKANLVHQYTNGRSDSSKDLSVDEAKWLISDLEAQLPAKDDPRQKMRAKVFSLCREMGLIYGTSQLDRKINQARVYALVKTHGHAKPKPLMDYDQAELVKLVNQLQSWKENNARAGHNKIVKELLQALEMEVAR